MKLRYRDDVHAYWLDGARCRSVTAVAKIPDDTYALNAWAKRMVAVGMAVRPDLAEAIAAHHDDRDKLDELVEVAIEAAKANDASRKGTAKHRITERHDAGESILMTPLAEQTIAAWSGLLEAHGLEVVPELIERVAVWPHDRIAGRFDRGLRDREGRLVIADLKTGGRVVDYPHAIAVQLALYAYAPLMAGTIPPAGGETSEFEPVPEFRRDIGYVLHLPDEGEPALLEVDIAAGWDIFQTAIRPTLAWRKRAGLIRPVETSTASGVGIAPAAVEAGVPGAATVPVEATPDGSRHPSGEVAPPLVAEIRDRIARLDPEQTAALKARWPIPVKLADIADDEIGEVRAEAVLALLDEMFGFDPPPQEPVVPERTPAVVVPERPAEGPPVDPETCVAFQRTFAALPQDARAWIGSVAASAAAAGGPVSLSQLASVRRFEIGRALVALAGSDNADDALVRLFAASAANDPTLDAASVTAGAALAALSADEAATFARLVDAHCGGAPMRLDERGLIAA